LANTWQYGVRPSLALKVADAQPGKPLTNSTFSIPSPSTGKARRLRWPGPAGLPFLPVVALTPLTFADHRRNYLAMSTPAQATWSTDPVDIVASVNEFCRLPRLGD
jgi:hypothetical protein